MGKPSLLACALLCLAATGAGNGQGTPNRFVVPAWAYPGSSAAIANPPPLDAVRPLSVPNSRAHFTEAQVNDMFAPPDWHPDAHPPMPEVVAHGRRPSLYACGYCHLPTGAGRPENATLAGLPADYIVRQVKDFRSGARRSAWHEDYYPVVLMRQVAANATDAEIAAAADYFSGLHLETRVKVVESARVPKTRQVGWLYARIKGGGSEPLGHRIIEVPLDQERHELRDSAAGFIAYVPPGSIERGRTLVTTDGNGLTQACVSCHGADLRGIDPIPPLAGRSPTYVVRQLLAFRTGARSAATAAPMRAVAEKLEVDDMIAIAAYVAAQRP